MLGGVGEAFGHMLTEGFPKLCTSSLFGGRGDICLKPHTALVVALSSVLISAGAGPGKQGGGGHVLLVLPRPDAQSVDCVPVAALGAVDPFKLEHKNLLQCVIKVQP